MSSIAAFFASPGFRAGLYAGNALWHTSAFIHFGFLPQKMMRKLSTRVKKVDTIETPEGDAWHHDLMRYLGGINAGFVVLAALRFLPLLTSSSISKQLSARRGSLSVLSADGDPAAARALDIVTLSALAAANASQAALNFFWARPSGRWIVGHGFDRITVLDTVFTILDVTVVALRAAGW
ncbi:hypothetical protein CBOM_07164 [Ceraceosorus bombacis]|uniref:Uncharacterized protein n=1 Tax=Ceraceosorus bombacis TaxID=401625 RepID=A0A0P1B790_9BASI|nr:hypothetical protein CBOM_07164 [Ceraceosorus bombacis]